MVFIDFCLHREKPDQIYKYFIKVLSSDEMLLRTLWRSFQGLSNSAQKVTEAFGYNLKALLKRYNIIS